jgi:hypothetical protein
LYLNAPSADIGVLLSGGYVGYWRAAQSRFYIGGSYLSGPVVVDWSTATTPYIQSGTSATSLTLGTNKSAASLILQQDAAITAWTLSGGNALVMQAPITATSILINQANQTANSTNGSTMTIQSQNSTGTTTTGGQLILTSGTGTTQGGLVVLQVGGTPVFGVGLSSSGGAYMLSSAATVTTGATTLAAAQYLKILIVLTGSLSNNATLVFPNQIGFWIVDISGVTLNAHTLAFTSGSTTTSTISAISNHGDLVFISCYGGNTIVMNSGAS